MPIIAAAAIALAAATLPATATAHDRWERGWRGHGQGYGHYKPWKHGYYAYRPRVVVPAPVYAVPYPRFVPAPVYAPPPVYYPPVGGGFTFIWRSGW
jgi:hypothetical protein